MSLSWRNDAVKTYENTDKILLRIAFILS
jgi:hypothetical protein